MTIVYNTIQKSLFPHILATFQREEGCAVYFPEKSTFLFLCLLLLLSPFLLLLPLLLLLLLLLKADLLLPGRVGSTDG